MPSESRNPERTPQEIVSAAVELMREHADIIRDCSTDSEGSWAGELESKEDHDKLVRAAADLENLYARSETEKPDVLGQVEAQLRKNPLIARFLDQEFWHAHHVDVVIRYNGEDKRYEADWIKDIWYIVRRRGLTAADSVRAEQRGEVVAGGERPEGK